MKHGIAVAATLAVLTACADAPTESAVAVTRKLVADHAPSHLVYTSGSTPVTAYDPIFPDVADATWPTTSCTATPAVGLGADWQNPHPAVTGLNHPWINSYFTGAGWINAWDERNWEGVPPSKGPDGQSWTKYTTQVQGNGSFVIQLLADNCSWIYLDGTLVGVQNTNPSTVSYGLTLNGTHELSFIIFDGGGAAGGKFKLETTNNPPPPLNTDLDNDGHENDADDFPLDPTRWNANNRIANGSFERPVIGAGPWPLGPHTFPWQIFNSTDQGLTGWTVEANTADTQSGEVGFQFTGVPDGVQVLDLNNGVISQAAATQTNYKYRVSFALSKNYVCVGGSARVRVAFGGDSQEFTFAAGAGESAENMRWDAHSFEAVSSPGASSTLRFTATGFGGCGGPMLDAVSVEEIGPADVTPPSIVPAITGTLGSNGWYTSDVHVSWSVTDDESAVSSMNGCDATSVTQDTNGATFTCTATSSGGTDSRSVTVQRDGSAPAITPTVSGTTGLGGWYTSDVTVSWSVTDGTSGIASSSGCTATTTATDNGGTTYTCTATNGAGLSATGSVTAKRDATKPVIGYTGNAGSYTVDQAVAITCSASDAMSGLASTTCANIGGPAYTFAIGTNSFAASAQDHAGNANAASAIFTVAVTPASLCALVKRFVTKTGVAKSLCEQLVNGHDDDEDDDRNGKSGDDGKKGRNDSKRGGDDSKDDERHPTKSDLKDFREHLQAQSGKSITPANAAILLRLVNLLG